MSHNSQGYGFLDITPLKFSGEEREAGIGGDIYFYAIVNTPSIDKMLKELSTKVSSNLFMSINKQAFIRPL